MCGNPRRYFKEKTILEKRDDLKFKDDILHFENNDYDYDEIDELSDYEISKIWENEENEKTD